MLVDIKVSEFHPRKKHDIEAEISSAHTCASCRWGSSGSMQGLVVDCFLAAVGLVDRQGALEAGRVWLDGLDGF